VDREKQVRFLRNHFNLAQLPFPLSRGEQSRTSFVVSKAGQHQSPPPVFEEAERSEADEKTGGGDWPAGYSPAFENYQQLSHRHAPSFIRDVLEAFSRGSLKAAQAAEQLGLSRSRLYALCTAYLRARARKQGSLWIPGRSGGDHATPWPQPVLDLLDKRLNCTPPCPYSFAPNRHVSGKRRGWSGAGLDGKRGREAGRRQAGSSAVLIGVFESTGRR